MKTWMSRIALALLVSAWSLERVAAQQPAPVPFVREYTIRPVSDAVTVNPQIAPANCNHAPPPAAKPGLLKKCANNIRASFNRCGMGCCVNEDACGNLHDTLRFIFGSCRSFWQEDCNPLPPHSVHRR